MTPLEQMKGLVQGKFAPPAVAKLIGFDMVAIDRGVSVFEMETGPQHANPMGTLHGGILCDLADAACGTAMASTLEEGETFTSLDLSIKFLKPVWSTKLKATARVVKRTKQLGLIECEIVDPKGSLVARVYSTCMALRGEEAKGR